MPRKQDPDKALVDRYFDWHTPETSDVGDLLTATRAKFKALANHVLRSTQPGDDRKIALDKLHDAAQAAIFAIVAPPEVEPPTDET
jgi:hypothetical protein